MTDDLLCPDVDSHALAWIATQIGRLKLRSTLDSDESCSAPKVRRRVGDPNTQINRIRAALTHAGRPLLAREIAEAAGVEATRIASIVFDDVKAGLIVSIRQGTGKNRRAVYSIGEAA